MQAYERFLNYVKIHTTSEEGTNKTPSTDRQLVLAELLCNELNSLGAPATVDAHGYVYARIPASPGCEQAPALGLIAHMDTAPSYSGEHVTPVLHPNYDGGDVALPKNGLVLRAAEFPALADRRGKTLITADGSTLLGADDKAGVAEIVTVCEQVLAEELSHGTLCIAFTPDEEIGEGADHFDVEGFGADFAYTVDGDAVGEINYENFNAASAVFEVEGVAVHPGSAKGVMENAALIACEINAALPANEIPAKTEGYEGFYHLEDISADGSHAQLHYIVRDHDAQKFEARKLLLQRVAEEIQTAHPTAKVRLTLQDSYYNMAQKIKPYFHLVENAKQAALRAGVQPQVKPIRGGTDGARLSFEGLPCPNLGTGGDNFHGPLEYIAAEDMDAAVKMLRNLIATYAQTTL